MLLFIDGSVDPKSKIGFGAYLLLSAEKVDIFSKEIFKQEIQLKKFHPTSSTKLEIETLLWALEETEKRLNEINKKELITIYSDSQNVIGLPKRRIRLQFYNFKTKTRNKELKNADLYKRTFEIFDRLNCRCIKLAGHSKIKNKNNIEKIFAQVDRYPRKSLRKYLKTNLS